MLLRKQGGGYVAKAKPLPYRSEKDTRAGLREEYSSFVPHEMEISPEGKVLREIKRGTYKKDASGKVRTWDVYESEITDYEKQTRYTFGKRDLKSGRQTIQKTSELAGGEYKERRIIHQDSKEHEQAIKEHELFQTFVGQGRSMAEARILSRMTEAQREAKFRAEAKARTQRFGIGGRAITEQHKAQREFVSEYRTSAQKYATDIVGKQEKLRQTKAPVPESPKPVGFQPSGTFEAPTPASPTTRTDMGTGYIFPPSKQYSTMQEAQPFQFRKGMIVTDPEKYRQEQLLAQDNIVQRGLDKYRFEYEKQASDFGRTVPIVGSTIVPFAVGATNIVVGTVAHPIKAFESLLEPVELAMNVRAELTGLTQTKGEVYSLSYLGGTIAGAELIGRAGRKGFEIAKDVYVKTGSEYVEPESVFSKEVLEGKKTFPTTTSTAESLASFNKVVKSYDIQVAEAIVKNPEVYAKPPVKGTVLIQSEVLRDIKVSIPQEKIAYTGGVARRILTGEGRVRDVDVVTATPKQSAYAVAKRFPEKYEVIQHEIYPDIYRLRTRKGYHSQLDKPQVVADFDPTYLAEEGFINKKSIIRVGEYNVVRPEVMLKSKAIQIIKGKVSPKYPLKQAENIQQLSPGTPILKEGVVVSTVSPAKLKGLEVTGKIEKVGLEDPGVYVSPKGEASAYFSGIGIETTSYSLNPFKGLFGVPTVTEFAIKGVRTYPIEVVMKPGFEHLAGFQKSQAGKGYVYITKRSQVGTGDVPRQRFYLEKPTEMSGKTVEPGWRWEAGTVEKEAVIGEGELFEYIPKTKLGKIKGFDVYTTYKGRAVAVREARLLTEGGIVSPENTIIEGGKVQAGAEAFDVVASEGKLTTTTPLSYSKMAPFGSLKTAEISGSKLLPAVTTKVDLGGVSSRTISSKTSLSGMSRISPTQSVISKVSSVESVSPVSRGGGAVSESIGVISRGGLSSGKSFGGSSGISRGGSSTGISRGGSTPTGGSGGSSGRPGEGVPPTYPRVYPRPEIKAQQRREKYKVQVRKKGIFKTIAVTETPEEAFRIGKFNVEQTASASLRVQPISSGEKVTGVGKGILPLTKFRLSTKEPDVFIQRRKFRIGTPGEKKEITFKGIQVLKGKKRFGGLI